MAAKILIDTVRPHPISWCWRDDWYTGACSAFALLMKFALLNAVSAKDIASAFISRKCGKKSAVCARPNVDLRDPSLFDIDILSDTFGLEHRDVRSAFLFELVPGSEARSSEYLRWCEACMARGFHTPVFQMTLLGNCPLHQKPLRSFCTSCGAWIPYRLQQEVMANPFCCPSCKADLAPGMRDPRPQVMLPRAVELAAIARIVRFFVVEHKAMRVKSELLSMPQFGQGEIIFSRLVVSGRMSRYVGFVTQVLKQVRRSKPGRQAELLMERLERAELGTHRCAVEDDDDPALRFPSWANRVERPDNSLHVMCEATGETELRAVTLVYRAIKRHLWRHTLRRHRRCIIAASRHLWWRVEDETTTSFCPVAEAFLRWRMSWEGCGTPRYLFGTSRKALYGLIGWVSSRPSPCPTHWKSETQLWVIGHIFANACVESFRERLAAAALNDERGTTFWQKAESPARYDTFWALTGADVPDDPAVVYLRCPMPPPDEIDLGKTASAHFNQHLTQLVAIAR